jgi:hypothetical protein
MLVLTKRIIIKFIDEIMFLTESEEWPSSQTQQPWPHKEALNTRSQPYQ